MFLLPQIYRCLFNSIQRGADHVASCLNANMTCHGQCFLAVLSGSSHDERGSRDWPGRRSVAWRPGLMIVARSHYNFNPFLNLASEPFGPPWPLAVGTVGSGFSMRILCTRYHVCHDVDSLVRCFRSSES